MRLILIFTALLAFQSAAASPFDETKALADQGLAAAQYNLGIMYRNGRGVPKNDSEAVKWYRKAADQGHSGAQYNLVFMYAYGEGVPESDSEAQFSLGVMYANGEGVPENDSEWLASCLSMLQVSLQRL
jgi:TPR repeat protein